MYLICSNICLNFSFRLIWLGMQQVVMSFMECLERCVGHMAQLSLTDELSISHMHTLPSAVIQTVKEAFKHCKVHLYFNILFSLKC